jgi:molybdopterin-guanine dinucleotide biosynthesis protein A
MRAVVLAGSAESELTRQEGVPNKSLIHLGGRPVLLYILEALRQVPEISRIVVVGPAESLKAYREQFDFDIVAEEGGIAQNIHAPFKHWTLTGPLLLVTGDVPLLTREALEDFLEQCRPFDLDFYYPIIPREAVEKTYPGTRRTYVPLKEGVFTGGNIFIARAEKVVETLPQVEDFFRVRKSFIKMVAKLGPVFILKYITRRLIIEDLVQRFKVLFNVEAKAVITRHPEIGIDMDKVSDLTFFRERLNGIQGPGASFGEMRQS